MGYLDVSQRALPHGQRPHTHPCTPTPRPQKPQIGKIIGEERNIIGTCITWLLKLGGGEETDDVGHISARMFCCLAGSDGGACSPGDVARHGWVCDPTVVPYVVITQATWSDSRLIFPMFCVLVGYEDEHAATAELSPCWSMWPIRFNSLYHAGMQYY